MVMSIFLFSDGLRRPPWGLATRSLRTTDLSHPLECERGHTMSQTLSGYQKPLTVNSSTARSGLFKHLPSRFLWTRIIFCQSEQNLLYMPWTPGVPASPSKGRMLAVYHHSAWWRSTWFFPMWSFSPILLVLSISYSLTGNRLLLDSIKEEVKVLFGICCFFETFK